ncbi:MAG: DUF2971 domain-containing protein [Prevotellaceae bacterium]|nr:DUF2971 domain-containing protein [Prevotellaceae bacterium]
MNSKNIIKWEIKRIEVGIKNKQYPEFLYKYRAANNCNTDTIITKNELWFSDPNDFNDPYDCHLTADDLKSEEIRKYLKNKFNATDSEIDNYSTNPNGLQNKIEEATERVLSNLGVCCFSKLDDIMLQWAHYADRHTGICLKFDLFELCKGLGDNFIPLPVHYQTNLPHYNHCVEEQRKNVADILVKPKSCCWEYEQEIRIVKQGLVSIDDNDVTKTRKRKVSFNPQALKEVIFGAKTKEDTIKYYQKLCTDFNRKHIVFSKMQLGMGQYYELIKK